MTRRPPHAGCTLSTAPRSAQTAADLCAGHGRAQEAAQPPRSACAVTPRRRCAARYRGCAALTTATNGLTCPSVCQAQGHTPRHPPARHTEGAVREEYEGMEYELWRYASAPRPHPRSEVRAEGRPTPKGLAPFQRALAHHGHCHPNHKGGLRLNLLSSPPPTPPVTPGTIYIRAAASLLPAKGPPASACGPWRC